MQQQRPVETVEEFKLRIAAIIRAKPEQISAPPMRPHACRRSARLIANSAVRGTSFSLCRIVLHFRKWTKRWVGCWLTFICGLRGKRMTSVVRCAAGCLASRSWQILQHARTAPPRNEHSIFATTPCHGHLLLVRWCTLLAS